MHTTRLGIYDYALSAELCDLLPNDLASRPVRLSSNRDPRSDGVSGEGNVGGSGMNAFKSGSSFA